MTCDPTMTTRRRPRSGWRPGPLLREATKNVLTTGGGALVVLCVAVLVGAGSVAFEAHRADAFNAYVDELRAAGRNIVVFTGTAETGDGGADAFEIERASCEQLAQTPGVVRAGVMAGAGTVTTEQFGPFVPVIQVSAGLLPDLTDGVVVVGSALGAAGPDLTISVDGSPVTARVGVAQPATTGLNSAIAVLLAAGQRWAPTCLAEIDAYQSSADVIPALSSQLVTRGGQVNTFEPYTGPSDVAGRYRSDPARYLPWILALFGAVLAVIRAWAGASSAAAYRLSGTTPAAHAGLLVLEQVLVAGVFVTSASLAALVCSAELLAPPAVLLRVVQGGLLWLAVFTIGISPMLRADPTVLAKDR